ncbi:unnamed protein product [Onchocerca flexuosa]|uniref:Uncharacterized protein n=1 Tax=Onchocerca flexuosa TaxID=387005 RepID=A0A183H3P5_9BILA|nr:unnamed protein product [Onchocerca flexuosa]
MNNLRLIMDVVCLQGWAIDPYYKREETGELSENDHSFQRLTTNFEKTGHRSTSEGTPSMPMKTEMRAGTTASLTLQTLLFIGKRQLLFIMEIRRSLLVVDAAVCLLIGTLLFFIPSIVAYFIFVSLFFLSSN